MSGNEEDCENKNCIYSICAVHGVKRNDTS